MRTCVICADELSLYFLSEVCSHIAADLGLEPVFVTNAKHLVDKVLELKPELAITVAFIPRGGLILFGDNGLEFRFKLGYEVARYLSACGARTPFLIFDSTIALSSVVLSSEESRYISVIQLLSLNLEEMTAVAKALLARN